MIDLAHIKRVYCIGLGGVGVSAVAKYFLRHGAQVAGSDLHRSSLIDDVVSLGARWYPDHDAARIRPDISLVVYTDACGPQHPERLAAVRLGIPVMHFTEAINLVMAPFTHRAAVAGTNGKSTTTALAALMLRAAGRDPSVFVGSRVSAFDGNFYEGQGDVFIAEADEYRDHFLALHPTTAIITNIEPDHFDYFPDLAAMIRSYRQFVERLNGGPLILNADDHVVMKEFGRLPGVITFGFQGSADVAATDITTTSGQQRFTIRTPDGAIGPIVYRRPGRVNIANALAAAALTMSLGIDGQAVRSALERFTGIWRRFEILNPGRSVEIVDDYAHHPTAVRATLAGARAFYPGRRIIAVFQPHHRERLQHLFDDFTGSFDQADETIIMATYAVPGRDDAPSNAATGRTLAEAIRSRGRRAQYADTHPEAVAFIKRAARPNDVIIIMGAGDIHDLAVQLAKTYDR